MEMMTNAINWFEIPVDDFERARKFYNTIYDFEMTEMDMEGTRMGMLPHDQENGVGGAIIHGDNFKPTKDGVKVYLNGGNDLSVVLDRVENAGGKVILPKTMIGPEMGHYAAFEDTEGNEIRLFSQG